MKRHRFLIVAFVLTLAAAAFPALAIDTSKTGTTLAHFGLDLPLLRTTILLSGVSPYNTRSLSIWTNAYRLCLYLVYIGCMWTAAIAALGALRQRKFGFGTTIFLATAALTLALPFLPDNVNGSAYFATRLVFVLWPGAILAASSARAVSVRGERLIVASGLLCCAITLITAEIYLRPPARQLAMAEKQALPRGVPGAILMGDKMDDFFRFHQQLAFDPYKWGAALAFVHQNDVALDTPWIDQKITPIEATPGGPELVSDISFSRRLHPPDLLAPMAPGRSLPATQEARIVRDSAFMVFEGTPEELARGLNGQLSPEEAAKYSCGPVHDWFVICTAASSQTRSASGFGSPKSEIRK